MSRDTEKVFKQLHEFIEKNVTEDMTEEEANKLISQFMNDYNNAPKPVITERTASSAEDFLELAQDADSEANALKYAKKALSLDPDNLDAEAMVIDIGSKDEIDLVKQLERAVAHGNKVMEKKGHMKDDVGQFWGVVETRPYMRLCDNYVEALISCGMMGKAITECEEMLRLCENDNLGMRFKLIHLYAYMEEEEKALKLLEKYPDQEVAMMLLPISILYFKRGDWNEAEKYLKRLKKSNKELKKFVKAVVNETLDREMEKLNDYGYRPYSIEELLTEFIENTFLFRTTFPFFSWANDVLK